MLSILGVLFFILLEQCNGVIYYLNETEYNRMPPIYRADNVNECLQKPDDVYCTVHFDLVSDERSELLDMIQEYSEKTSTHYNHTKIRYSVCVSEYCQSYIRNKNAVTPDYLERCLNHTIWNDYKLKTKVEKHYCHTSSDDIEVDASDITVAVLLLAILLLNIIGTINDTECVSNGKEEKSVLTCFSIRRNWKSLVKDTNHPDPRLQRFRGINFWRCFILLGVIMVHCVWPFFIALDNSYDLEMNYYKLSQHLILNGSIALQTYMVISGLLMSYKMELNSEEKRLSWLMVPRGILLRYFRLTPVYAVTIAVMATWTKFIGPGPFWEVSAGLVRSHCRTSWWQNLLYINNYFYNAQCIVGGWYLGVDMQMFVVGIVTCVALRDGRRRAAVLATLFTAGVLVLAVHIYIRDLHPIMILEPTETATFFEKDPTTNETYKMGHANVTSYIVGLTLGYLVYRLQKLDIDIKKYRSGLAFHNDNVCRLFMVNDHGCKIETGTIFENEPSFNEIYKMGHANVTSYIVGLALGYLVYRLQQYKIAIRKYRKYRYIYWSLPFLLLGIVLSGSIFYRDAPRDPTYIRALYGALVKPVFGIITAGLICGTIFKLENVYRKVMEWKVWTVPSRLSYCVYIIHLPCLRIFLSSRTTLLTLSTSNQWLLLVCVTAVSFSAALLLWLLVETPFVKLTKHWSSGRTDRHRDKQAELVDAGREKSEYANINTRL